MAKQRIHSKGDYQQEESAAAAAFYPGMLIELTSANTIQAHSTEGGRSEQAYAVEDALQGNTVDDAYSTGNIATYILPVQGGSINALLKAGYAYTIGMELVSAGDGTLIPLAQVSSGTTVLQVIARCTEAIDLSGSGAVNTLSEVRVL